MNAKLKTDALDLTSLLNGLFLRLCGPPSIPLSFTVAGVLPRWIT